MSLFKAVVSYIREFDPKFSPIPATPDQIRLFESYVGRPLPLSYRSFLEVMGISQDWLLPHGFDLRIETAARFYQTNRWLTEVSSYIRIGDDTQPPLAHPHLHVLSEHVEVVSIPDYTRETWPEAARFRTPVAGALDELVCMPVFEMFELGAEGRTQSKLVASAQVPNGLERTEALLARYGFSSLFFSSHTGHAYRHDAAAAKATQDYVHPLTVWVSADSPAFRAAITEIVAKELALTPAAA